MRVSYSKCAASVLVSLSLLTNLHAQSAADCEPIRTAIANRVNTENQRVSAAATSVVNDVARSRACVDSVLDTINEMIPMWGGGGILGSFINSLASQACQIVMSTANNTVGSVNNTIGSAVGQIPGLAGQIPQIPTVNQNNPFQSFQTPTVQQQVPVPSQVPVQGNQQQSRSASETLSPFQRLLSIF